MPERENRNALERLAAFSDGVFAVIITIMVLDIRPPHGVGMAAMRPLWPTVASYALSFLFTTVAWVNHRQLLMLAERSTRKLTWSNMGFLFTVSLIPFSTAYMAQERMAPFTVAIEAFVFLLSTIAFVPFEETVLRECRGDAAGATHEKRALLRNALALVLYAAAIPVSYWSGWVSLGMIVTTCLLYFAPEKLRARAAG